MQICVVEMLVIFIFKQLIFIEDVSASYRTFTTSIIIIEIVDQGRLISVATNLKELYARL